jgi:hypothetical protein
LALEGRVPGNTKNSEYWMALQDIRNFWLRNSLEALPASIMIGTLEIPFIYVNKKRNDDFFAFMNSKAKADEKKAKVDEIMNNILYYFQKENELWNLYVDDVIALEKKEDLIINLVSMDHIIDAYGKATLNCFQRAAPGLYKEMQKNAGQRFIYKVILSGTTAGTIKGVEMPTIKSKFPEFLKDCTSDSLNKNIEYTYIFSSGLGQQIICIDGNCFVSIFSSPEKAPVQLNRTAAASIYENVKAKGMDPKRYSQGTQRKIPDAIELPSNVDKVTNYEYKPPCADVADCAKWFCNYFLKGPFARVEKVINPQEAIDELEQEASKAYNSVLNSTFARLLAEEQNELSDSGLNFIAVADNTALATGSINVDGVSEPAQGYSNVVVNSTLDENSSGGPKLNVSNETNSTKGNSSKRIINMFSIIICSILYILI